MPPKLTDEIITAAIEGYESQKTRIDDQIAELRSLLTGGPAKTAATADGTSRKRWKLSAETRRRMKEAQQRRWAKIRGASEPSTPVTVSPKPKRKISEVGRKTIAEAARRRWAAVEAAKEKPEPSATKKATHKKTAAKKSVVKKATVEAPIE
jgi:hypothetical protein